MALFGLNGAAKMRKRLLVVDDVADWRETLESVLKSECEVISADGYEAAWRLIQQREVDLAIVDLRLSPTDENNREGLKILELLTNYRINAIVLTGYPEEEVKREVEEKYKAFEFIDKAAIAGNIQRILEVVREAFALLEKVAREKAQAIRQAKAGQVVTLSPELSSWPLKRWRKK